MKAIIVDDDATARSILQKFLEIDDKVLVVANVSNTADAFQSINRFEPDVIFLDINMPEENGINFAKKLRTLNVEIPIVFTTAYSNYAHSAFNIKPIDFIVKPFGLNEVFDVLTKIDNYYNDKLELERKKSIWGTVNTDKFKFRTLDGYLFVNPKDIVYLQTRGDGSELIMANGKVEILTTVLSKLYVEMKHDNFLRINRSTIINLSYVESVDKKMKLCVLKYNHQKVTFKISKLIFVYFDNLKSLKI